MFGLSIKEVISCVNPTEILNGDSLEKNSIRGVSLDTRDCNKNEAFLAIRGSRFDGHDFLYSAQKRGSALLIVDKITSSQRNHINIPVLVVSNTVEALGKIAQKIRFKYAPFVCGIVGSLGKTTVKDMVHWSFRKDLPVIKSHSSENNHIGAPKTLMRVKRNTKLCVLELGTNNFGEISYLGRIASPTITVFTCIEDVHLKSFKNKQGVLKEKSSIFKVCPDTIPVINGDDVMLSKLKTLHRPVFFGKSSNNDIYFEYIKKEKNNLLFRINSKYILRLNSLGTFNIYNIMAALGVCVCLGKSLKKSVDTLSDFKFPKMRLEMNRIQGVKVINDAYNSSPAALRESLEVVRSVSSKRKIAVLADMLELGDNADKLHEEAVRNIFNVDLDYLILIGDLMKQTGHKLIERGFCKDKMFFIPSVNEAKQKISKIVKKGDLVFLKGSRKFSLEKILQ